MLFTSGLPETRCGAGSTLAHTESLRSQLPDLIARHGFRTILDAPCGDGNWIAACGLTIGYHGVDLDPENVAEAMARGLSAQVGDLMHCDLPPADVVLCRDLFQHLPNYMVLAVLSNFRRAGFKWMLANNYVAVERNAEVHVGGFRKFDLAQTPFKLPRPFAAIQDGDHILALWSL